MLDKITELAEAKGLTEGALESLAGLTQGRISKWKRAGVGKGPSAKEALVMARILEVPLEWLVDDAADPPAQSLPNIESDERIVLHVYRDLRDEFGLTDEAATRSLLRAAGLTSSVARAREDMQAPVLLSGQAALDAIAASTPILDPPQVIEPPKRSAPGRSRRKA